jgi:hypothetical protein
MVTGVVLCATLEHRKISFILVPAVGFGVQYLLYQCSQCCTMREIAKIDPVTVRYQFYEIKSNFLAISRMMTWLGRRSIDGKPNSWSNLSVRLVSSRSLEHSSSRGGGGVKFATPARGEHDVEVDSEKRSDEWSSHMVLWSSCSEAEFRIQNSLAPHAHTRLFWLFF